MSNPLATLRLRPDPRDPRAPSLLHRWDGGSSLAGRNVLLGLPYAGGIPSRPGARFGPKALREALSAFGTWDGERELSPVLDLGDLPLPSMNGAEAHRRIEAAAGDVFAAGAQPVFLGGDHGCTGSLIRGLAAARPDLRLSLISIDAHLDVREYPDDASISSGTPFRRALQTPILSGGRTAMLGIRRWANSRFYTDWSREQGVWLFTADDITERGAASVAREALDDAAETADALYLSIDLDAADSTVAPGTSAAGPGGLMAREMIALVQTVAADSRLVGADIMELSPPYDGGGRTAKLAAHLLLELLAVR